MNKEAVQRLREPAAWVLLASSALQLLAGILVLFNSGARTIEVPGVGSQRVGGSDFSTRAARELTDAQFFSGLILVALLVIAVLLVTSGSQPTKQARNIVTGALAVLGLAALLTVVVWLGSLVADIGALAKFAAFLFGVAKLAVIGVAGWYIFTVFQALQPPKPAAQPQMPGGGYPEYGYQQDQGQQYQQGGYQQEQGQQYQQGAYQQDQGQQSYDQGGYQQGQQSYDQGGYQQGGYQQDQGQQYQQGGYQQQDQGGEGAGDWTRAYGEGQQPYDQGQQGGYQQGQQPYPPQQDQGGQQGGGDWYREGR
ncbi:hypothetical protein DPM19_14895 [Actinomadura craniellae]|uniref:Uncharacterized protein n=1 Tax=Actinomadura craniellae TaxID=2231787 RepID=A0A365H7M1_9ACTN|nr:hypothetical protein [Actinomadura craniellae]RAY14263.1 hypothetical protein DPM19_14895 [Actinomadura craniellae]